MAEKIKAVVPGSVVFVNKVPKAWVDFDIYCQLVPNNDPNEECYEIVPKIGAFEVSFKGIVRLILSYISNFSCCSQRCSVACGLILRAWQKNA